MTYYKLLVSSRPCSQGSSLDGQTHRNEEVRHAALIFEPSIAILLPAASDVAPRAVRNHAAEEDWVEPGEGTFEASDESPRHREPDIRGVVNLACKTVPAINKDGTSGRLDDLGIVDGLPRNLREGPAVHDLATLRSTEAVLLRVAAVPDPVPEEVGAEERSQSPPVPTVGVWVVIGKVDRAVAVGQRNTSKVPKNEHETPFLIVHVPGGEDEFLGLAAGIGIEPVSHKQEANFSRYVAVHLVLACSSGQAENDEEVPRHAHLAEHLEVKNAEHARVELGTHEEVIDGVAGHAVLLAAPEGGEVGNEGDNETAADGNRQQRTKLVDNVVKSENTREVQNTEDSECRIHANVRVAVIRQTLVTGVRQRLSVTPNTRKGAVTDTLEYKVRPVPSPDLELWESTSVKKVAQMTQEVCVRLIRTAAGRDLAIVVGCANPHVPHEKREEDHESQRAEGATELKFA